MKFTRTRGAGNRQKARYAYAYELRATAPATGKWYSIQGTLRVNAPLTERRIRTVLMGDLIAEAEAQTGTTLRQSDLKIDHFVCTNVS